MAATPPANNETLPSSSSFPPSPAPPPISPVPPKSHKLLWFLLIFLFVIAVAGYFSYSYYQKNLVPPAASTPSFQSSPNPTATVSAIPADWQTYTNEAFGFSFSYPKTFILTDTLPKTVTVTSPQEYLDLKDQTRDIQLNVIVNTAGYGPFFPNEVWELDYAKEKGFFSLKTSPEDVQQYRQDNYFEIRTSAKVIVDKPISFMFRYLKTADYKRLFDQILSTFKFTNSSSEQNNPKSNFCGGLAGVPCPSGYYCKLDGNYPDAGGTCLIAN